MVNHGQASVDLGASTNSGYRVAPDRMYGGVFVEGAARNAAERPEQLKLLPYRRDVTPPEGVTRVDREIPRTALRHAVLQERGTATRVRNHRLELRRRDRAAHRRRGLDRDGHVPVRRVASDHLGDRHPRYPARERVEPHDRDRALTHDAARTDTQQRRVGTA